MSTNTFVPQSGYFWGDIDPDTDDNVDVCGLPTVAKPAQPNAETAQPNVETASLAVKITGSLELTTGSLELTTGSMELTTGSLELTAQQSTDTIRTNIEFIAPYDAEETAETLTGENGIDWWMTAIPRSVWNIVSTPELCASICIYCANLINIEFDTAGTVTGAFCGSCRSVLSRHPAFECRGGSAACVGKRFVDAIGAVSLLCTGCHKYGGKQLQNHKKGRRTSPVMRGPSPRTLADFITIPARRRRTPTSPSRPPQAR